MGRGPWATAIRKLCRDRPAVASLIVLLAIVLVCLFAPLYAAFANTDPFKSTIDATIELDGRELPVMEQSTEGLGLGFTPIGPTWQIGNYFLGADNQGRDVMARLLYGGRNSLLIGLLSALLCCAVATVLGVAAGYSGGIIDGVLSRFFDVLWAVPVYLLAICLSVVLLTS